MQRQWVRGTRLREEPPQDPQGQGDLCQGHTAVRHWRIRKEPVLALLPRTWVQPIGRPFGKPQSRYVTKEWRFPDGTCETVGCVGFGTPTSRHCPKHTCPERDCKASTGTNHYCDIRESSLFGTLTFGKETLCWQLPDRCEFQGCQSSRGWKKNLKDREKFCPLRELAPSLDSSKR